MRIKLRDKDGNDLNFDDAKVSGMSCFDYVKVPEVGEGIAKADNGKLQIALVPPQIIRDIAEVRMYGNAKYHDPNNWRQVEPERYINALLRHTLLFMEDPTGVDEESGIPHYKHMACNMAFLCEMLKEK